MARANRTRSAGRPSQHAPAWKRCRLRSAGHGNSLSPVSLPDPSAAGSTWAEFAAVADPPSNIMPVCGDEHERRCLQRFLRFAQPSSRRRGLNQALFPARRRAPLSSPRPPAWGIAPDLGAVSIRAGRRQPGGKGGRVARTGRFGAAHRRSFAATRAAGAHRLADRTHFRRWCGARLMRSVRRSMNCGPRGARGYRDAQVRLPEGPARAIPTGRLGRRWRTGCKVGILLTHSLVCHARTCCSRRRRDNGCHFNKEPHGRLRPGERCA